MNIDRILQISNDVSKGRTKATKQELVAVIQYWKQRSQEWNNLHQKRMDEILKVVGAHIENPHP